MRKILNIFTVLLLMSTTVVFAEGQDTAKASSLKYKGALLSRNINRGVGYGESPSVYAKLGYAPCKYFELGAYGYTTLNGNKEGYGNELNLYTSFTYKEFSLTFDDYFYEPAADVDNNYFDWTKNKTQHTIEARAKYDSQMDVTIAYAIYGNKADTTDGIYFELGYDIRNDLSIFAGYLTSASMLNFQDKGGVTNVGLTYTKAFTDGSKRVNPQLKISLIAAPTHKTISELPSVGSKPMNFVVGLWF